MFSFNYFFHIVESRNFQSFCNIHHFLFFCFRFALLKCFLLYFATYKIHLFYYKSFSFALLILSIRRKRIIYVAILLLFMSCFLGDCLLFSTLSFVFRNGRLFLLFRSLQRYALFFFFLSLFLRKTKLTFS